MPKRKNPRLERFDYSLPGTYFVTICTQGRRDVFGMPCVGRDLCVPPNAARRIAEHWVEEIHKKFPQCQVDHAVVMPNHVHLLLTITYRANGEKEHAGGEAGHTGPALRRESEPRTEAGHAGPALRRESESRTEAGHAGPALRREGVPRIIQWYKTMTTNACIRAVKEGRMPPFEGRLWQPSFYDHVVRNERDYLRIWQYIDENPLRWTEDIYYEETTP